MTWYLTDGTDGSGKSSVASHITGILENRGRKVLEITHPNRETIPGRISAAFLKMHGKLPMLASTAFYIIDVLGSVVRIKHVGKDYDDIVFVRYILAVAYLPRGLMHKMYRFFENLLPMPDVKIFVDLSPDAAMERILSRGEELEMFETREKLEKTRDKMSELAKDWFVVDNSGTIDETMRQTDAIVARSLLPGDENE